MVTIATKSSSAANGFAQQKMTRARDEPAGDKAQKPDDAGLCRRGQAELVRRHLPSSSR